VHQVTDVTSLHVNAVGALHAGDLTRQRQRRSGRDNKQGVVCLQNTSSVRCQMLLLLLNEEHGREKIKVQAVSKCSSRKGG